MYKESFMRKIMLTVMAAATILEMAQLSSAAGFRVSEQGAKATGMANAFAAQADDPSALAYNPAGIAFLKGSQFSVGTIGILVPQTEFTGTTHISSTPVSEKSNHDIFLAPIMYVTSTLESVPLSCGLGINSFFPLAKRWDAGGAFRDSIQEISIKPINFQPTVAYRLDALNLGVAAGFDITYAIVSLQKMAFASSTVELGNMGVDGSAVGYGYNLGAQWKPLPQLSFGAAYRSPVKLNIEGDANFAASTATGAAVIAPGTTRSNVSTDITLPDILMLAVAWKPAEQWTLEFDAERTGWSSYDKLELNFDNSRFAAFNNKPDPKNWEDVWAYRFGGQYAATSHVDLRAGYAYDTTPAPDATVGAELPDADRHNLSFGLGLHDDRASFDLGYMWVKFADRTANNAKESGTFKSDAHVFAASASYRF